MPSPTFRIDTLGCLVMLCLLLPRPLAGQSTGPVWQLLNGDCQIRVLQHVRSSRPACDDLQFIASAGTETFAYCRTRQAPVIPELKVEVPVSADRTGLQIRARVVLPRAINPATGSPYTVLVAGDSYQTKHHWQSLVLDEIADKMERCIRVLQLETAHPIDPREAYLDMVLINLFGGPGKSHVQLGDVGLDGAAETSPTIGLATWSARPTGSGSARLPECRLSGDLLFVRGEPFLARMIDDNGEDWKLLSELGLNTVRLTTPATVEQTARAESCGLWIVCPPPEGAISVDAAVHWRRVLAWDLSAEISDSDVEQALQLALALRRRDGLQIPILCDSPSQARSLSRAADIVLHHRATLGTEYAFGEYADWVAQRVDQSHPGTVHWMGVDTQPGANLRQQLMAFGCSEWDACEFSQLHLLTRLACMRGIRGIYFRSETRLNPASTPGRKRALAIRQANIDLDILQPWVSSGQSSPITTPTGSTAGLRAWQSVRGSATLVSVVVTSGTSQFCPDAAVPHVSLLLPAVTAADNVMLLSPAGMPPLRTKQMAGGAEVSVPLRCNTALLLVTRDPNVVRELADKLNRTTPTIARLTAQRIDFELADVQRQGCRPVAQAADSPPLNTLRDELHQALGQENYVHYHHIAGELLHSIAQRRFDDWRSISSQYDSPAACPLATQPSARRWLQQFQAPNSCAGGMLNLLAAGSCDSIEQVRQSGWQLMVASGQQQRSSASIVTDQKHGGTGCLQLHAAASEDVVDTDGRPWIWATTPPTTVPGAQIFRLDAWARHESEQESASLLMFDSLGGPACGLRIMPGSEWKQLTLYRATQTDTPVTLTFALSGPGRVWIDDVSLCLVQSVETLRADILAAGRQHAVQRR